MMASTAPVPVSGRRGTIRIVCRIGIGGSGTVPLFRLPTLPTFPVVLVDVPVVPPVTVLLLGLPALTAVPIRVLPRVLLVACPVSEIPPVDLKPVFPPSPPFPPPDLLEFPLWVATVLESLPFFFLFPLGSFGFSPKTALASDKQQTKVNNVFISGSFRSA